MLSFYGSYRSINGKIHIYYFPTHGKVIIGWEGVVKELSKKTPSADILTVKLTTHKTVLVAIELTR